MRTLPTLLFVFISVLSSASYAAEEFTQKTHSGRLIVGDSSEYSFSDSSEVMRQPLRFTFGGFLSPNDGSGYTLGYYWNPDLELQFEYRMTHDSSYDNDTDWDRDEKALSVHGRFYMVDGWAFSLGLVHRAATFSNDYYYRNSFSEDFDWQYAYDIKVRRRDFAARAAIGSQWQWSSFYFGIDLLSWEYQIAVHSISASIENETIPGGPKDEEYRQDGLNKGKTLFKSTGRIAFRLGFAF